MDPQQSFTTPDKDVNRKRKLPSKPSKLTLRRSNATVSATPASSPVKSKKEKKVKFADPAPTLAEIDEELMDTKLGPPPKLTRELTTSVELIPKPKKLGPLQPLEPIGTWDIKNYTPEELSAFYGMSPSPTSKAPQETEKKKSTSIYVTPGDEDVLEPPEGLTYLSTYDEHEFEGICECEPGTNIAYTRATSFIATGVYKDLAQRAKEEGRSTKEVLRNLSLNA